MGDDRPAVAVWRSLWLPPSETFVRDHVQSLRRWRPVPVGLFRQPSAIAVNPARAPFSRTGPARYLERVSERIGDRGVFDRLLTREKVSLVHAHFGPDAVRVLPIARRLGLPLAVTFHGYDVLRAPQDDERYRRGLTDLFEYASRVYVVSEFLREKLVELGAPQDRVRLHYLGVPVARPLPDPSSDRRGVCFVGRLRVEKGVTDLLDAYSRLPREIRRDDPLEIVGDGPLRDEVARRAADIGGVHLHGVLPPEGVRSVLARSRVFAGPSRLLEDGAAEPFGLVFLEAASAGCAVVGYRAGGVREGVVDGRTGLLVEPGDVSALATALEGLLRDPARARALGSAGQARVVSEFDILDRTAALEDDYDELTRAAGGG